jgi:hypothetical protein
MDRESGFPDDEGAECADLDSAQAVAIETLGQIAKDELSNGANHDRDLFVTIRNAEGRTLLVASLALRVVRPS